MNPLNYTQPQFGEYTTEQDFAYGASSTFTQCQINAFSGTDKSSPAFNLDAFNDVLLPSSFDFVDSSECIESHNLNDSLLQEAFVPDQFSGNCDLPEWLPFNISSADLLPLSEQDSSVTSNTYTQASLNPGSPPVTLKQLLESDEGSVDIFSLLDSDYSSTPSPHSPASTSASEPFSPESTITINEFPKQSKRTRKVDNTTRYERKKEQNKVAALKYRQKKKHQEDQLLEMLKAEQSKQLELKKEYSVKRQERKMLKKLLREVYITKQMCDMNKKKAL